MVSKNCEDTPSEDGNYGGNISLKKGPWTTAEDAILVEYVAKHGEGNWNAVQKHSGLARCGKSCRLRWANHLRPDLKKGAFTLEEEHLILELHAKMGNKWARMAAELPGRTDNEIKNYWNTRIKRRQRAGLPVYPPDMCFQALNKIQQYDGRSTCSPIDEHHSDFLPFDNIEIPEFRSLELNQQLCSVEPVDIPPSRSLHMPFSSLIAQDLQSSFPNKFLPSMFRPSKRIRGSDFILCGSNPIISNEIADGNRHQCDDSVKNSHSFIFPSAYEYNPASDCASSSVLRGCLSELNCNPYSEPAWATKLELPSLQNQMGTWGSPASPLPSLESADTLIQIPSTKYTKSSNLYPTNSGLLDAVLYESEARNVSQNCYYHPASLTSCIYGGAMHTSSQDLPMTDWDLYDGYEVEDSSNLVMMSCDNQAEITNQLILSRPDLILASNAFDLKTDPPKYHSFLKNEFGTLRDDLSKDCKQNNTANISSVHNQSHGHVHDSCAWNAMFI